MAKISNTDDFVLLKNENGMQSGGISIDSFLLKGGFSPITNVHSKTGESGDKVSDLFGGGLAIPSGLFYRGGVHKPNDSYISSDSESDSGSSGSSSGSSSSSSSSSSSDDETKKPSSKNEKGGKKIKKEDNVIKDDIYEKLLELVSVKEQDKSEKPEKQEKPENKKNKFTKKRQKEKIIHQKNKSKKSKTKQKIKIE